MDTVAGAYVSLLHYFMEEFPVGTLLHGKVDIFNFHVSGLHCQLFIQAAEQMNSKLRSARIITLEDSSRRKKVPAPKRGGVPGGTTTEKPSLGSL